MRPMPTMIVALVLLACAAGPSEARYYPWCATYNDRNGATNCGFDTFAQCLATVSGIGGFCNQNPWFQPGANAAPRRKFRRQHG